MADNCNPSTNAAHQVSNFFLRILPEVVYKLNCVVGRNACWFTMATPSDGIDSQMMLGIIRESKTKTSSFLPWIRVAVENLDGGTMSQRRGEEGGEGSSTFARSSCGWLFWLERSLEPLIQGSSFYWMEGNVQNFPFPSFHVPLALRLIPFGPSLAQTAARPSYREPQYTENIQSGPGK